MARKVGSCAAAARSPSLDNRRTRTARISSQAARICGSARRYWTVRPSRMASTMPADRIAARCCEVAACGRPSSRDLVDLAWLCADQVQDPKAMGAGQGPQHRGLELIDVVRCALAFHHAARASWFEQIRRVPWACICSGYLDDLV